jgi:hypothetical protein
MIKVQTAGDCCTITLARPDKANALTEAMLEALALAATDATTNGAKVLILTGEGKVFSAGADLDGMKQGLGLSPAWEAASGAIAAFPGLTIAALNGTLAGGAMGVALACDLRIAVPDRQFLLPGHAPWLPPATFRPRPPCRPDRPVPRQDDPAGGPEDRRRRRACLGPDRPHLRPEALTDTAMSLAERHLPPIRGMVPP